MDLSELADNAWKEAYSQVRGLDHMWAFISEWTPTHGHGRQSVGKGVTPSPTTHVGLGVTSGHKDQVT